MNGAPHKNMQATKNIRAPKTNLKNKNPKPQRKIKNQNRRTINPSGVGRPSTSVLTRKERVVEEDEFIANIAGSVAFSVIQYPINPGQATTFPWLSLQAKQL